MNKIIKVNVEELKLNIERDINQLFNIDNLSLLNLRTGMLIGEITISQLFSILTDSECEQLYNNIVDIHNNLKEWLK